MGTPFEPHGPQLFPGSPFARLAPRKILRPMGPLGLAHGAPSVEGVLRKHHGAPAAQNFITFGFFVVLGGLGAAGDITNRRGMKNTPGI